MDSSALSAGRLGEDSGRPLTAKQARTRDLQLALVQSADYNPRAEPRGSTTKPRATDRREEERAWALQKRPGPGKWMWEPKGYAKIVSNVPSDGNSSDCSTLDSDTDLESDDPGWNAVAN